MTTVLLDVTGISKAFPGTLALDNVGLQLRAGEIHAVMGENGAGKSTLLYEREILNFAGLLGFGRSELMRAIFVGENKSEGEIVLDGTPLRTWSVQDAIRHGIGYLHEEPKAAGLFVDVIIKRNTESAVLRDISGSGWMLRSRASAVAETSVRDIRHVFH